MTQTVLLGSKLSVAQLLGIAVLTWTLQLFLRKWIKAKRVAHSLPYVPPFVLYFSPKCFCWQFISTGSCFDPLPSLPTSRLSRRVILSVEGTNWLDVCKILVYIHFLWFICMASLTYNLSVQEIWKFLPHFNNILGRHSNLLVCGCGHNSSCVFR